MGLSQLLLGQPGSLNNSGIIVHEGGKLVLSWFSHSIY